MGTRDEYVADLKSAFVSIATKAAMGELVVAFPFLANPVLYKIAEYIVRKILSAVADKAEMGAFFLYIDTRTSSQGRDFEAAAFANRAAQTSGTEEEKAHAEKALVDAARSLIAITN